MPPRGNLDQVRHRARPAPARSAHRSSPWNRTRSRRESPGPRTCRTWSAAARPDWYPTRRGSSRAGAARAAPNAVSKNLAWRCQAGSLVSGVSGESADGIMPARNFAVSSTVAVSAARDGSRGREQHDGSKRHRSQGMQHVHSRPAMRPRDPDPAACGRRRKSGDLKHDQNTEQPTATAVRSRDSTS